MTETIEDPTKNMASAARRYREVRDRTEIICSHLETEDFVVQPIADVSPPKWHLGHTTWFFETFLLMTYLPGYRVFNENFGYVFNSYYEHAGKRVLRTDRGNLSRPTVDEVRRYRMHVDAHMIILFASDSFSTEAEDLLELGLHHEQQHQELLVTDIKYILGHNPLFPSVEVIPEGVPAQVNVPAHKWESLPDGIYEIGHDGNGFCFDNELKRHKVYLNAFQVRQSLVSNGEFMEFIESGGYQHFGYWLSEGWAWVQQHGIKAPLYWHYREEQENWQHYTFSGMQAVDPKAPLCHISFYEADAFARWKGLRLPTEAEWEAASSLFPWGLRWEWTNSAYLPYPGFQTAPGAVGEYNGKFMSGQMVLRGASEATPPRHSRPTYRNFFQPDKRWQYTGIRLASG